MEALGRHILVEFFECDPQALNDIPGIEAAMVQAAQDSGATVLSSDFHHFSPHGVSGVVLIQESHLAIHTWPEYQYAAADLFTCGDEVDPWLAFDSLKAALSSKNYSVIELHRGALNLMQRIPFNSENFRQVVQERLSSFPPKRSLWFTDKDDKIALSLRARGELLFDEQSPYQRTRVFNSYGFGHVLTIDNMVMCTERDEAFYHEMICHPAMFIHGAVKRALIIGGGDGGTARQVLRHAGIEQVDLVEIDANVIEASKRFFPDLAAAFEDPRLHLRVQDGIEFVASTRETSYDLVIIDGADPVGPAKGLYSEDFFRQCYRVLKQDGMLVANGESPDFNRHIFVQLYQTLGKIFNAENVHVLLFHIPSYPTGLWSFQLATKQKISVDTINQKEVTDFCEAFGLRYYNAEVHKAGFVLPNYVKGLVEKMVPH